MTIHQLLTHTSGMGDYLQDRALQGELGSFTSATEEWDAILAVIRQQPLLFPPGSRWGYSNSGFFTLGAIVAQVSGGGWSTAPDMLRFARALWQWRLLRPAFTGIATSAKAPLPASAIEGTPNAAIRLENYDSASPASPIDALVRKILIAG